MKAIIVGSWCVLTLSLAACAPPPRPAWEPGTAAREATLSDPPVAANSPPIDPAKVAAATGGKPEVSGDVVKVSFPRGDVAVEVDGWAGMPPFMGLTSWAGFEPGKSGVEAMVMGDLVLFEDEVSPVMSAALDGGLDVTALHNHFFFAKPHVYFMHIGGEGTVEKLGSAVKSALGAAAAVRAKAPQPATGFGPPPPLPSHIDAAKLDPILTVKGTAKDGMYKAVMGRAAKAACGCAIGKAMGVNTWAAFGGSDDDAVVDGDFAVTEAELQPVLKALRGAGIHVVAIHSHMTGESPRTLFLHYWGRGKAAELAAALKTALDLTAWEGKSQATK